MTAIHSLSSGWILYKSYLRTGIVLIQPVEDNLRLDLSIIFVGDILKAIHDQALVQIRPSGCVVYVAEQQHISFDQRVYRFCLGEEYLLVVPSLVRLDAC